MNCKNCKTSFDGKFCPTCGQKSSVKRLTLLAVFSDFVFAVTDTERGFLKTIIDLSQRPGPMVQKYIEGKRSRYISAGKYTFFIVVLFTINISLLENHFGFFRTLTEKINSLEITNDGFYIKTDDGGRELLSKRKNGEKNNTVKLNFGSIKREVTAHQALIFTKTIMPLVQSKLFDYSKFLIICWIPLFAFLSLLCFLKSSYNLAEHFTFNAFIFSHMLLIFMLISPLYWLAPDLSATTFYATSIVMTFYLGFSYMQFFDNRRYRFIKTAFVIVTGMTSYLVLSITLSTTLLLYLVYENLHLLD